MASLASCVLSFPSSHKRQTFPQPLKTTGNGAQPCHDPSIAVIGNKYYLFATHNNGSIAVSDSLTGPYTSVGSLLPSGSSINLPGRYDIWAPDVEYFNDQFYAYYSVSSFGSQDSAIGVATSKTMAPGSWTDHGLVVRSYRYQHDEPNDPGYPYDFFNAIDANVLFDNGVPHLSLGSFYGGIFTVPLSSDGLSIPTNPTWTQVAFNSSGTHAEEGSFVYKHGSSYFLFFSAGICCAFNPLPPAGAEYKVLVGKSSSINGPFLDANGVNLVNGGGTLVIGSHDNVYAPGGNSVFFDKASGRDVFVYCYTLKSKPNADDAILGLNYISWTGPQGFPVLV